jgi:hypothetical protein
MGEEFTIKQLLLGIEHIFTIPASIQSSKLSQDIVNATLSITAKPPFREVVVEVIKSIIAHELAHLTSARYSISVVEDADWGFVYIVTLEASAREALEVNLELQRRLPDVPIVVKWTGGADLSEEELVDYVLRVARAGGFKARAQRGFSSVEVVREVREE